MPVYARLKGAGISPIRVGDTSYLTAEHLETMAALDRHIQEGGKRETFNQPQAPTSQLVGTNPPQHAALAQVAILLQGQQEAEESPPDDLVAAEVEHLDRPLSFLSKAARLRWSLPTSSLEISAGGQA